MAESSHAKARRVGKALRDQVLHSGQKVVGVVADQAPGGTTLRITPRSTSSTRTHAARW